MFDRICSSTAPPTAPSGASVSTDSRNASDATTSSDTQRYATISSNRSTPVPAGISPPIGADSGAQP